MKTREVPRLSPGRAADFWSCVSIPANTTECWLWNGPLRSKWGYGSISLVVQVSPTGEKRYSSFTAHRVAYSEATGPIPDGMLIRHRCDNPKCVNPAHLEVGTPLENMLDMAERGRSVNKAHCKNGHEFTEANTYWRPPKNGRQWRTCRACALRRARTYYKKTHAKEDE
jgi:hypothetical protein